MGVPLAALEQVTPDQNKAHARHAFEALVGRRGQTRERDLVCVEAERPEGAHGVDEKRDPVGCSRLRHRREAD